MHDSLKIIYSLTLENIKLLKCYQNFQIILICVCVCVCVCWLTVVDGDPKATFSIDTSTRSREGTTPFPGWLNLPFIHQVSVKQGSYKYYFSNLRYDPTWD